LSSAEKVRKLSQIYLATFVIRVMLLSVKMKKALTETS